MSSELLLDGELVELEEGLTEDDFKLEFDILWTRAVEFAALARKEGILALESQISDIKEEGDPFVTGIRLCIDGTEDDLIIQILDNIEFANSENDLYSDLLYRIAKQSVLAINRGWNPRVVDLIVRSLYPKELGKLWKKAEINDLTVIWEKVFPE